jgi:hypothetical protein
MKAEISFDLVMEDDMDFVEGTYRLLGGDWQVVIFSRRPSVEKLEISTKGHWASGVTGVSVRFPKAEKLNKAAVMRILSEELGMTEWQEVHGPDSMQLR